MSEPAMPPTPPPPPPPTEGGSSSPPAGGDNRSLMIVLSYLWLLALIPLLTAKEDKEVQWHAKHGIVLLVAEVALWIVLTMLMTLLGAFACFGGIFVFALWVVVLVVHVLCIVKGVGGQRFMIPGISQYADRF